MKQYLHHFRHMETSMKVYIFMWGMIGFSAFGLQAVLLNLYLVDLGYDAAAIGRLLAVAQICFGLAALPAGVIGARGGPRAGLMVGTAMYMAGWILFLLGERLPGPAMHAALQGGLAIALMGNATMIVNGAPYLMCITEDATRSYSISFQQAFQALMGLVGGFVAGWLPGLLARAAGGGQADAHFYHTTLWLIPIGFLLAFLSLLLARPVSLEAPATVDESPPPPARRFPFATFAIYMLIVYLAIVGDTGARSFFNLYLKELGLDTQQIGVMIGFNQIAPLITALSIPAVLRRAGIGGTFSAGAILLGVVLLLLSLASGLVGAAVGFFLMALMATVLQATRSLVGQELVEPRLRTYIAATATISMSLGNASSSLMAGSIIPTLGFPSLFRISGVIVGLSGLIALAYLRSRRSRAGQNR